MRLSGVGAGIAQYIFCKVDCSSASNLRGLYNSSVVSCFVMCVPPELLPVFCGLG